MMAKHEDVLDVKAGNDQDHDHERVITLLVIEDEPDIQEILQYNLGKAGYRVVLAGDGQEGLEQAERCVPDLVLLDLMLPKMDGLEVCGKLRALFASRYVPIVMLTAKGEESDTVSGFEAGADDYVIKPFSTHTLLARIKAHLRRYDVNRLARKIPMKDDPALLHVGPLTLDKDKHVIYLEEQPLILTLSEFRLLAAFISSPGVVFSRSELLSQIADEGVHIVARNIDVHVLSLRKKLKNHASLIQTIRGVGYKCQNTLT